MADFTAKQAALKEATDIPNELALDTAKLAINKFDHGVVE